MISFDIVIRTEAERDLDQIFIWYEEQKTGLGKLFIYEFESTLNRIIRNPYYASIILRDARSASLKKFPYEIIYRVYEEANEVRIIAITHQHRNPRWFTERFK